MVVSSGQLDSVSQCVYLSVVCVFAVVAVTQSRFVTVRPLLVSQLVSHCHVVGAIRCCHPHGKCARTGDVDAFIDLFYLTAPLPQEESQAVGATPPAPPVDFLMLKTALSAAERASRAGAVRMRRGEEETGRGEEKR